MPPIILFHKTLSKSHGPKPQEPLSTLSLFSLGWLIEEVLASQALNLYHLLLPVSPS